MTTTNKTTRSKQQARDLAEKIAAEHGCEILPTALGGAALSVTAYYNRGDIENRGRLRRCFAALRAAGISTYGWVS